MTIKVNAIDTVAAVYGATDAPFVVTMNHVTYFFFSDVSYDRFLTNVYFKELN